MASFDGKVAFITGGGTGIGRAIAERIVAGGGRAVVAGRRERPLREVAALAPHRISYVQLDVADLSAHEAALATTVERYGRLDILVNNAALSVAKPFQQQTDEDILNVLRVNLAAPAVLSRHAVPLLAATKGNIVNISSAAGKYTGMPPQMLSSYSASKAGLNQLTRILATELGPLGIRVNAVSPGVTETEICEKVFEDRALIERCIAATPLGRTAVAEDIAPMVCFLASEEAAWVTGQIVDATGGYHLAL